MLHDRGVLLTIAYDGTAFLGWATQKVGRTVEDTVRGAILAVDPHASPPRGVSRTAYSSLFRPILAGAAFARYSNL